MIKFEDTAEGLILAGVSICGYMFWQATQGSPYIGGAYTFWYLGVGAIAIGLSSYLKRKQ